MELKANINWVKYLFRLNIFLVAFLSFPGVPQKEWSQSRIAGEGWPKDHYRSVTSYKSNASEIIRISPATRHLIPNGKEVDAIDGDWIMRNDKVIAVIGNAVPGREANQMVPAIQGAVIDFTSLAANNDNLVAYYPQGYRIHTMSAHRIEVVKSKGREIILRAIRNLTDDDPYVSVTEYTLKAGENFLRVKTTHRNDSEKKVSFFFGDQLRLDNGIADASPVGNDKLAFIYNKWFGAAYGIYCHTGLHVPAEPVLSGGRKGGISAVFQDIGSGDNITLRPGQQAEVERYLLCDTDVAEIQKNIIGFKKTGIPITTLKLSDTSNEPVADAFVEIFDRHGEKASFALTDAAGSAEVPLTPGNYKYIITKVGHDTVQRDLVVPHKSVTVSASMKPVTRLTFTIRETGTNIKLPVRLEFKGINGTPDPYLGIEKKRAEGTGNLYYAFHEGPFRVPLSPGEYSITVSHGPEYNTETQQIQIRRGENKAVSMELKREYSTPNWIIADFHNHTTGSGDNNSEIRSRIINMAAEGIEFAPATEHNRISSFTDEIKNTGLQAYIASCPGIELSGLPGPIAINHQIAFPLRIREGQQGGGFPGTNADPYLQMKGLYGYDSGKFKFMQQNHPDMPWLYFDKDQDGILDPGFGTRSITHAMEINNFMFDILDVTADKATDPDKKNKVFYWLQMLNQGDRIYVTANSDNHAVGVGSGSRFNYVYSYKDDPSKIDAVDIARNAKQGHIIMSNGPFIKTDLNGSLPGDELKADHRGGLTMNIEVYSTRSKKIERVQLLVNGRQHKDLNFTVTDHPHLFGDNALRFKHSFPLSLKEDAHVIVVAQGMERRPVSKKGKHAGKCIAVANPFFVDVDGNGFEANKDLLGVPLPVAKKGKSVTTDEDDD
jgi:hypothetical protein